MSDREKTHGAGWLSGLLAALEILVRVVAAAIALWLVISFPVWWPSAPRIPLPVPVATVSSEHALDVPIDTAPIGEVEFDRWHGELEVRFANAWAQWWCLLALTAQIALAAVIIHHLRRATRSFARHDGLRRDTAGHLRWAGGLMILESLAAPAIALSISALVLRQLPGANGVLGVDWLSDLGQNGFISGWVLLILSEAVRQGAELRDDQSLTI